MFSSLRRRIRTQITRNRSARRQAKAFLAYFLLPLGQKVRRLAVREPPVLFRPKPETYRQIKEKARRPEQVQKRVNVDFPLWMLQSLDREARRLGVPRQAVIKI